MNSPYVVGGPSAAAAASSYPESEDQAKLRFQVELEFVQCLANPNYLNFLAQRGHLKEKPFINYLKYLLYWKKPEYASYLKYPQCLNLLELLQYEGFRTEIINTPCAKFIEDQLLLHWQHYPRKRLKLLEQHAAQDAVAPTPSPAPENAATPGSGGGIAGGSTPGPGEGGGGGGSGQPTAPTLQSAVMQSKPL